MPGTQDDATELSAPAPEVGATDATSDNAVETAPETEGDDTNTSIFSEADEATDESEEADDESDAESDDQPESEEPEFVGLDQYEGYDSIESGDNTEEAPEFEIPTLDPDALVNQERWNQSWAGILKRESRVREQESAIDLASNIARDMESAEGTDSLLARIAKYRRDKFGAPPDDSFRAEGNYWEDNQSLWFTEEGSYSDPVVQDVTPELATKVLQQLGIDPEVLKELTADKAKSKEEITFMSNVESSLPEVNQRLQSNFSGLRITSADLARAMKARPGYAPYDAILSFYEAQLLQHKARSIKTPKKPMPTMPKGKQGAQVGQDATLDSLLKVSMF